MARRPSLTEAGITRPSQALPHRRAARREASDLLPGRVRRRSRSGSIPAPRRSSGWQPRAWIAASRTS